MGVDPLFQGLDTLIHETGGLPGVDFAVEKAFEDLREDLGAVAKQVRALAKQGVGVVDVIKCKTGGPAKVIIVA